MRFVSGPRTALAVVLALLLSCLPAYASHDGAKAPKKGILLVAFGTSVPEAKVAFENVERMVKAACPDVPVRWAFTSNIIRRKLAGEGVQCPPSVPTALAGMLDEGFTHVAIQSLHSIPGEEFNEKVLDVAEAFRSFPGGFAGLSVGLPMMTSPADMERVADTVLASLPEGRKKGEPVVLMGHGTHHPGNIYYPALQWYLAQRDPDVLVGTVEGTPDLDYVRAGLKARGAKTVWLMPLMAVAGDHARNDMAGSEADSWKSVLEADGCSVWPVLKGTAEYESFGAVWIEHLKAALGELD